MKAIDQWLLNALEGLVYWWYCTALVLILSCPAHVQARFLTAPAGLLTHFLTAQAGLLTRFLNLREPNWF